MSIPLEQIANMPAFSPYYPMPPARYRNVQIQYVHFRAETAALDRVLPACFEPADDGYCVAFGLSAAWSANYGRFEESGLFVKCTYNEQQGYFSPVVFLNSRSSIPAGREIYGTPKVFADIQVGIDAGQVITLTTVDAQSATLGTDGLLTDDVANANLAITGLDAAIDLVNTARGQIGSDQNRLGSALASILNVRENLAAAESRIRDVDVASETADLTRNAIMQQAAVSVLGQANVQPQLALSLLGG